MDFNGNNILQNTKEMQEAQDKREEEERIAAEIKAKDEAEAAEDPHKRMLEIKNEEKRLAEKIEQIKATTPNKIDEEAGNGNTAPVQQE